MLDADQQLSSVIAREESRLRSFIRRRVRDPGDAEDILQDVLYALVRANSLLMPIDHVTAWLFRVARNRITDFFRNRAAERGDDAASFEDLLPSPDAGPDAVYARRLLVDELEAALDELPPEQREAFATVRRTRRPVPCTNRSTAGMGSTRVVRCWLYVGVSIATHSSSATVRLSRTGFT